MKIIAPTVKCIKGNVAGASAAALSVIMIRPTFINALYNSNNPKEIVILQKTIKKIPSFINKAYIKFDAPKSGKFFTQSVGDVAEKIFKFFTNKK